MEFCKTEWRQIPVLADRNSWRGGCQETDRERERENQARFIRGCLIWGGCSSPRQCSKWRVLINQQVVISKARFLRERNFVLTNRAWDKIAISMNYIHGNCKSGLLDSLQDKEKGSWCIPYYTVSLTSWGRTGWRYSPWWSWFWRPQPSRRRPWSRGRPGQRPQPTGRPPAPWDPSETGPGYRVGPCTPRQISISENIKIWYR